MAEKITYLYHTKRNSKIPSAVSSCLGIVLPVLLSTFLVLEAKFMTFKKTFSNCFTCVAVTLASALYFFCIIQSREHFRNAEAR